MKCKNCGHEMKEKETKCSACGLSNEDSDKIKITYEDEETELVDPPVITEAHTFIDEESFAKKVNRENRIRPLEEEDMWDEPSRKNPMVVIFVIIILIVLGLVGYFVVYPNIKKSMDKPTTEIKEFSSEEWSNGEFKIDEDFYKVNQTYTVFYQNNWSFVDDEITELSLDPQEETEEYVITNSFNNAKIRIRLKNTSKSEKIIKDSNVWSVKLDTTEEENDINFVLPGEIKNGSTEEEIKSIYGTLSEENVIRDEENKLTTYHYSSENKKNLDLTIYDEKGLKAFHYYFS